MRMRVGSREQAAARLLSLSWALLSSLPWGSCRDPWLTSPTGDQWRPLNYCVLREETKSDLAF